MVWKSCEIGKGKWRYRAGAAGICLADCYGNSKTKGGKPEKHAFSTQKCL
jgi:hypothetical protein